MQVCERETVIRWDEERTGKAELWTASKDVADRLIKAGLKPVKVDKGGWWFELTKASIRLKPFKNAIRIAGSK